VFQNAIQSAGPFLYKAVVATPLAVIGEEKESGVLNVVGAFEGFEELAEQPNIQAQLRRDIMVGI